MGLIQGLVLKIAYKCKVPFTTNICFCRVEKRRKLLFVQADIIESSWAEHEYVIITLCVDTKFHIYLYLAAYEEMFSNQIICI